MNVLITQKGNYNTLINWWENGKFRIQEIIQEYGKEKTWEQKQQLKNLQRRYDILINDPHGDNTDTIQDLEFQLKKYEIDKWKKAQIRVRNIIKDEREKASNFFLNLEKPQIIQLINFLPLKVHMQISRMIC